MDKYICIGIACSCLCRIYIQYPSHKAAPKKCMTIQCACLRQMMTKVDIMHTVTMHLFKVVSVTVGSQDSILLQQGGHHIFKGTRISQ